MLNFSAVDYINSTGIALKEDLNYSIIDIQGEVTGFAEDTLMDAFSQASNGETTRTILLNFTDLEYMKSSGIGL